MQQLRVEFQPKGIASSKSPRWEHKLEVSKTQQEEQGMRGSGGGGKGWRSGQEPGHARSCPLLQSVVQGPAASASPESLLKMTPTRYFLSSTAMGLSHFRWHTSASGKDHCSTSPLQRVVAVWHKESDIWDFPEVPFKGHPLLLSAVWNTSLKANSPASTLYYEMPSRMEATQGQTINEEPVSLTLWQAWPALSWLPLKVLNIRT